MRRAKGDNLIAMRVQRGNKSFCLGDVATLKHPVTWLTKLSLEDVTPQRLRKGIQTAGKA